MYFIQFWAVCIGVAAFAVVPKIKIYINFIHIIQSFLNQNAIYGDSDKKYEIRYMLGFLEDERGQIGLYFNNDTGEVDWCDFEYGEDPWEANPRGIISNSIKEFIDLLEYE